MNMLAQLCGDVAPLSEWREQFYLQRSKVKMEHPDDYKDRELRGRYPSLAEEEFASLKRVSVTNEAF